MIKGDRKDWGTRGEALEVDICCFLLPTIHPLISFEGPRQDEISVVPLSSKLKDNPVHVIVEPSEIRGYALSNRSDFMPEDIQTLNKGCVRFKSGYIPGESEIREAMDRAMIMQLNLLPVARKMVLEELEMKQNG